VNKVLRRSWILLLLGGLLVALGGSASTSGAAACNTITRFDVALSLSSPVVDLSKQDHSFTATVTALDASCNPAGVVTSYKGPATLTASGTPPNGQPVASGAAGIATNTAVKFKQGVATLTVTPSSGALGVTLAVTDNSASSITGTSGSFDVFTETDTCGASDCSGDVGDTKGPGGTSVSVSIPEGALSGFLGLSLGASTGTTCPGVPSGAAPFGQSYIIAPPSGLGDQTYTATVRFNKKLVPGTGVSNFVHCMATPSVVGGQTVLNYQLVPVCNNKNPVPKCIVEQHRDNAGDLVVTFLLGGSTDPGGTGFS
jgi:hypothetical protein